MPTPNIVIGPHAFQAPVALFGAHKDVKQRWLTMLRQIARVGWQDALQNTAMQSLLEPPEEIVVAILRGDIEKRRRLEEHWWLHFIGLMRPFGGLLEEGPYERDWQMIIEGTQYLWYTLGLLLPQPESFPKLLGGPFFQRDPDFKLKVRSVFAGVIHWLPEILLLQPRLSQAEMPYFQHLHPLKWATGLVWYAGFCNSRFPRIDMDEVYRIGQGDISKFLLEVGVIERFEGRFRLMAT